MGERRGFALVGWALGKQGASERVEHLAECEG